MSSYRIPAWITWISGVVVAAITSGLFLAAYVFTNFETVAHADRREVTSEKRSDALEKRLESMDAKLDILLQRD